MNKQLWPVEVHTGAATAEDVPAIAALLARQYAPNGDAAAPGVSLEKAEAYLADVLTEPAASVRVVKEDGQVVGCLVADCSAGKHGVHRAIVTGFVCGPHANPRAAMWLMMDTADDFHHRGVQEVWVTATGRNSRRRTLSALGFAPVDTDPATGTTLTAASLTNVMCGLLTRAFRLHAGRPPREWSSDTP